jgi:branched-subunit amino acid aminotransferase/4-amino-4-deoxychorismate lyase
MYSFGQRDDTKVVDEPLYAHWLNRNPLVFRPYREELLRQHNCNGNSVMKELHSEGNHPDYKPILLVKQIAKQYTGVDKSHLHHDRARHVFLIRNPIDMLEGWQRRAVVHKESSTLEVLSLPQLVDIYSEIRSAGKVEPIVIDAEILQNHPREVLTIVCAKLGIPFQESMLGWDAGPKANMDGLWAPFWYQSAHKSTGFYEERSNSVADRYHNLVQDIELIREALPFYDMLRRKAIGVNSLNPGSSSVAPDWSQSIGSAAVIDGHGVILDHGLSMHRLALGDARNEHLFAWVGDRLLPRELAKVSAFDSAVQGGDAVWEGLRIYDNKVFKLDEHLHRLYESAKAMAFTNVPSPSFIRRAIAITLKANNMSHNTHIRLTLSRGPKLTSSMNPAFNVFGCTLIVLPEFKAVGDITTYDNRKGIRLITACNRRNPAQCVDSKIHHNNLINNILPKIQANNAGAADALMLDLEGFVSETNATNVFMVKDNVVYTPPADSCLPGITRRTVLDLCRDLGIAVCDNRRLSLTEFYAADEVFTTGTMGELTPVYDIDGRFIGPPMNYGAFYAEPDYIPARPVLEKLATAYSALTNASGMSIDSLL